MKYLKPINEFWGDVLKRDLLGETREEDKFHTKEELKEYLKSEIERQGENVVIKNLDVSLVEDLSMLLEKSYDIKSLDLSGWKTSNVKDMRFMFHNCINLKSLDVSGWDTSNVEDMSSMFQGCKSLISLDSSGWDTSNVKAMRWMFKNCESLKSLDLSGWDTSSVDRFNDMFTNCPAPYKIVDDKIVKTMNECGASGCLTFGDVSGMGDIILPGDNPNNGYDGVRGSGDLPMPSAGVYTQVAPLTLIKKKKYKNKKKKKPHHTPNPSMYDYVDDYLDYVDRTYKTIDKLKK